MRFEQLIGLAAPNPERASIAFAAVFVARPLDLVIERVTIELRHFVGLGAREHEALETGMHRHWNQLTVDEIGPASTGKLEGRPLRNKEPE